MEWDTQGRKRLTEKEGWCILIEGRKRYRERRQPKRQRIKHTANRLFGRKYPKIDKNHTDLNEPTKLRLKERDPSNAY